MRLTLAIALLSLAGGVLSPASSALVEGAAAPVTVVRTTVEALTARLNGLGEGDPVGARDAVAATVWPRVDFDLVSRLVLGPHWRRASPDQRQRFVAAFKEVLLTGYAETVRGRANRRVSFPEHLTKVAADRAVVATVVESDDGPPLRIDYRLVDQAGEWKLIDIAVAGVSLAGTFRRDFALAIEKEGLDGLIAALAERAARPPKG